MNFSNELDEVSSIRNLRVLWIVSLMDFSVFQSLMHFHVTDTALRWSVLFKKVDDINQKFFFEDVFVSDTTLEQIFLSFAKMQKNADEDGIVEDTVDDAMPADASSTEDIIGSRY